MQKCWQPRSRPRSTHRLPAATAEKHLVEAVACVVNVVRRRQTAMRRRNMIANVLVGLVAVIHLCIVYLEMVL